MSDETILKRWPVGDLECLLWAGKDPHLIYGAVLRDRRPIANTQLPAPDGQEHAERALAGMAAGLQKPRGPWLLDREPITDIIMVPFPGQLRGDEIERLPDRFKLAHDVVVIPIDAELRDAIHTACDPAGFETAGAIDLRGRPLYAFIRPNAPRENPYHWDSDQRLQMCVGLSRLVRPTSISLRYAVRLIGRFGGERYQLRPGPVRGFGAAAWTSTPAHDWLSPADFRRFRDVIAAFDANPFEAHSRVGRAFWYFEYAARTELVDIRWPLIATALETLLGTNRDPTTQRFIQRVPQLARVLGLPAISNARARRMWGLRSGLVHGQKHGGLGEKEFALYRAMEDVLREALLRAVVDPTCRARFQDDASVNAAFPIEAPAPKQATCPSCGATFPLGLS